MTFCLVDGSVLSAPFDPQIGRTPAAVRDPQPPPTQMLNVEPSAPQTTAPTLPIVSPTVANLPAEPPETIASPYGFPEPASPAPTPPPRPTGTPLKTMVAPAPEVPFTDDARRPAVETVSDAGTRAPRPYALGAVGGLVLVVIVIVGVVWLMKRNNKTVAASNLQPVSSVTAENKTVPSAAAPFTEKINGAEIKMISIPGGTFMMGSPLSESGRDPDEGPQSNVTVRNFHLSEYEVTQAQYRAVMGTNPASFKGDDLPVESVSWNDALEFCRKLSSLTGRKYRLPSEAEWEYAARAGNSTAAGNVDALGWCGANSANRTHPVGQKQANAFGLYDMYGNVWEWTESKYRPYPFEATDGREDLQPTDVRVLRGGSWESAIRACRASYRRRVLPDPRSSGFRVALDSD
jgi:formylglycine-generating enzyme required for sulfatase activity